MRIDRCKIYITRRSFATVIKFQVVAVPRCRIGWKKVAIGQWDHEINRQSVLMRTMRSENTALSPTNFSQNEIGIGKIGRDGLISRRHGFGHWPMGIHSAEGDTNLTIIPPGIGYDLDPVFQSPVVGLAITDAALG